MHAEKLISKLDPDQTQCWECCRHKHKDKMYHYTVKETKFSICKKGKCNEYFRKDVGAMRPRLWGGSW